MEATSSSNLRTFIFWQKHGTNTKAPRGTKGERHLPKVLVVENGPCRVTRCLGGESSNTCWGDKKMGQRRFRPRK